MYAYIDESGNTGPNLFDPNHPIFWYGALITKEDFDKVYMEKFKEFSKMLAVTHLHAGELGIDKLSTIIKDLEFCLKQSEAKIHICKIIKKDLAVMKLYDAYFDSGENMAVPFHVYNLRPLRLLLLLKFSYLLDDNIIQEFWHYFLMKNRSQSDKGLNYVLNSILKRISRLPDKGSQVRIREAINWVINNPEAIETYSNSKRARYSHLPNVMAFPELLSGIESYSKKWEKPVIEIKHGRQDQFKTELKHWHNIYSKAKDGDIPLFAGEIIRLQRVKDSQFIIFKDSDSPGLQLIDINLWIYSKYSDGIPIPANFNSIIEYCFNNGSYYELSLENTTKYLEKIFFELNNKSISPEDLNKGKLLLDQINAKNKQRVLEYTLNKFHRT